MHRMLLCIVWLVLSCLDTSFSRHAKHANHPMERILGGDPAEQGQFPFFVKVINEKLGGQREYCGGSLVSESHVITAAHCVASATPTALHISHGRANNCEHRHTKRVTNIMIHPLYSHKEEDSILHDIAVIKLAQPFVVNASSEWRPVPLSKDQTPIREEDYVRVVGIGLILNKNESDCILRHVLLPVIAHDECYRRWKDVMDDVILIDKHTQICAGAYNRGTRKGDSGGAMVMTTSNQRHVQIALTAFGKNEPISDIPRQDLYPGVYTRIAPYCSWIEEVTQGDVKCALLEEISASDASSRAWPLLCSLLISLFVQVDPTRYIHG